MPSIYGLILRLMRLLAQRDMMMMMIAHYASRASVVVLVFTRAWRLLFLVLFVLQTIESSEFSTSQKWPPSYHSTQCLMGNTGSLINAFSVLSETDAYLLAVAQILQTLLTPSSGGRCGGLMAGSSCCVLGQDTVLSQCLSPPSSKNGYWQTVSRG